MENQQKSFHLEDKEQITWNSLQMRRANDQKCDNGWYVQSKRKISNVIKNKIGRVALFNRNLKNFNKYCNTSHKFFKHFGRVDKNIHKRFFGISIYTIFFHLKWTSTISTKLIILPMQRHGTFCYNINSQNNDFDCLDSLTPLLIQIYC